MILCLAKRNGKVVVLCEDFTDLGIVLQEFCDIKVTFDPAFLDENGDLLNGDGAKLSEIYQYYNTSFLIKRYQML